MSKQEDLPRLSFEGTGARQVRATALGRGTHGVPDVRRMVESQFHIAFPHRVWVAGQVGAPADGPDGTLRFPLRPSTGDDPFVLPCVVPGASMSTLRSLLLRTHDADVEDVVREGRLARVGGLVRYDVERGSVVFVVSELDPTPTAIELADARTEALRAVRDAELAAAQRSLGLGTAPLEVALVGGAGDAALERVEQQLAGSRYDVALTVLPVPLHGTDAPVRLAQAVRAAGRRSDVVLLVRDEGRPLGLAAYDALEVAQAVADAPVPVLAGLGGAGTRTACDEVAFASLPTAEAAAQQVLRRLRDAEHALVHLEHDVDSAVVDAAERCRAALAEAAAGVDREGEEAAVRSEQARRRDRTRLLVVCLLLAVLAIAVAAVTGRPLLLLGLLVPVLVWAGATLWWRSPTRGRRHVGQRDDDFTQVLVRLQAVRDELTGTRSPERVAVLRDVAGELVAQGRELLGRHLDPPAAPAAAVPAPAVPATAAAGTPAAAAMPAAASSPSDAEAVRAVEGPPAVEPSPSAETPGATRIIVRPTSGVSEAAGQPASGSSAVPPQESAADGPVQGRPASS